MRPVPIPDGVAELMKGRRVVIGEPGDPTRDDVRPCEYVVTASALYPGRPRVSALVEIEDADLALIAAGASQLWLHMDGGELPWSMTVIPAQDACPTCASTEPNVYYVPCAGFLVNVSDAEATVHYERPGLPDPWHGKRAAG